MQARTWGAAMLVLVVIAGCQEAVLKPEPEPEPIHPPCVSYCGKIMDECGYGPPGSASVIEGTSVWEDCPRDCTEARLEDDPCRAEGDELRECTAALTCEELRFEFAQGQLPPAEDDVCGDRRASLARCHNEHASG